MSNERQLTTVTSPRPTIPKFNYREKWEVVMSNKDVFELDERQMWLLKNEIRRGNRGMVMFGDFGVNISFIVSWRLIKRWDKHQNRTLVQSWDKPTKEEKRKPIDTSKYRKMLQEILRTTKFA